MFKNRLKSLMSGVLIGAMLVSGVSTFAAGGEEKNITAWFNKVNLEFNGDEVSKIGESYKLSTGDEVPFSMVYNGTTYLPIRKLSELFDKEIGWNGKTNTISLDDKEEEVDARLDGDKVNEMDVYKVSGDKYIKFHDLLMSLVEKSDKYEFNSLVIRGIDVDDDTFSLNGRIIYKNIDLITIDHDTAVSVNNYETLIKYIEGHVKTELEEVDFAIKIGNKYYKREDNSGRAFVSEENRLYITAEGDKDYSNLLYLIDILNGNYNVGKESLNLLDGTLKDQYADLYVGDPRYVNTNYDSDDIGYNIDVTFKAQSNRMIEDSRSLDIFSEKGDKVYTIDDDNRSNADDVPYTLGVIANQVDYEVINVSAILDYLGYDYDFKYDAGRGYYVFDASDSQKGMVAVDDINDDNTVADSLEAFQTEFMKNGSRYYEIDIDFDDFYIKDEKLYYDLYNNDNDFDSLEDFNALLNNELDTRDYDGRNDEIYKVIDIDSETYSFDRDRDEHKFYSADENALIRIEIDRDDEVEDITNEDDLIVEIEGKKYLDLEEWADYMDQDFDVDYDDDNDIEDYVIEVDYN